MVLLKLKHSRATYIVHDVCLCGVIFSRIWIHRLVRLLYRTNIPATTGAVHYMQRVVTTLTENSISIERWLYSTGHFAKTALNI